MKFMALKGKVDIESMMAQPYPILPAGLSEDEEDEVLSQIAEWVLNKTDWISHTIPFEDLPA